MGGVLRNNAYEGQEIQDDRENMNCNALTSQSCSL